MIIKTLIINRLYFISLSIRGFDYVEKGIKAYEEKVLINKQKAVKRMAKELGLTISLTTVS